jgi:hypothetical protein
VADVVEPRRKAIGSEHNVCVGPVIPGILGTVHTRSTRCPRLRELSTRGPGCPQPVHKDFLSDPNILW